MGGQIDGKPINRVDIYDLRNNKWTTGNVMPEANAMFAISAIGNKIYIFGGDTNSGISNAVRIYDITTDTWTSGTSMPAAGYFLSSSAVDNKIYVVGGSNNTLQIYDITTDTWTVGAPMPTQRVSFSSIKVGSKIYVIGGTDINTPNAVKSAVEIYDTSTDTWTTGKNMPQGRSAITSCLVGNKIYVMGGAIHPSAYKVVDIYDITKDTWQSGPNFIEARRNSVSALVNGKIYVIGGIKEKELTSVESLKVENSKLSVLLNEGETVQLSISLNLDNNKNFTWSSTNEAVATVDANGKVTAIAEGTTDIYAQNADGTFKEYIPVKVVEGIADELRLAVHLKSGEKAKLYLTEDSSQVTWSSMDDSTVTVSADGQITGVKKGLAIVQAELDGETYQIYVRVNG